MSKALKNERNGCLSSAKRPQQKPRTNSKRKTTKETTKETTETTTMASLVSQLSNAANVAANVVRIQSRARSYIATMHRKWIVEALEDTYRRAFFQRAQLKPKKRYQGWIGEWFLNKGFGFIRIVGEDYATFPELEEAPKDKYGHRMTIFCMHKEFLNSKFPEGAVEFSLSPNPKFPDILMATDIDVLCAPHAYIPPPTVQNFQGGYCGMFAGEVESYDPGTQMGIIKYTVMHTDYHIFFHANEVHQIRDPRSIKPETPVSFYTTSNPRRPHLYAATHIYPYNPYNTTIPAAAPYDVRHEIHAHNMHTL